MYHPYRLRQRFLRSSAHPAMFARFSLVAVCVSLADIGVLYALNHGLGLNVYVARVFSFAVAIALAYRFNRRFTFSERTNTTGRHRRILLFWGVFASGALLNYLVFASVVILGKQTDIASASTAWLPFLGVWIGGMVGMCFNYVFSSQLVFHGR